MEWLTFGDPKIFIHKSTIPSTPRQGSRNLLESVEAYLVQDWVRTLKRREVGAG